MLLVINQTLYFWKSKNSMDECIFFLFLFFYQCYRREGQIALLYILELFPICPREYHVEKY